MSRDLLNIGFGNYVVASRVVAVVSPASSPMRRLREDAKNDNRLIDATQGRKTRSIIVTDSNHVVLSAIQAETISQRLVPLSNVGSVGGTNAAGERKAPAPEPSYGPGGDFGAAFSAFEDDDAHDD